MDRSALVERIQRVEPRARRRLIAVAGPPASGKSTLAEQLAVEVPNSCMVPMDGFHLDNATLRERCLLARKGAPATFDINGFHTLLQRAAQNDHVPYPVFDRTQDRAIPEAASLGAEIETVIVEGNYLLLDADGWRDLMPLWDLTVYLSVHETTLRQRLLQRWLDHGFTRADALAKAEGNDLPNALLVSQQRLPADIEIETA